MAAARKAGIRVDSAGMGAYLIVPALFTRLSMLVLLPRRRRIEVMLSGILFQAYLGIALVVAYVLIGDPALLRIINSNILIAGLNLVPFMKLDGHHVAVEVISIINERGRLLGIKRWYDGINYGFFGLFIVYLAYVWVNSLITIRSGGSASELAYFGFITIIISVLLYRLMLKAISLLHILTRPS
jgi:hypothetical protein